MQSRFQLVFATLTMASACIAAEVSGAWIAEFTAHGADPQYARVQLTNKNGVIRGTWGSMKVEATLSAFQLRLSLFRGSSPSGTLEGTGRDGDYAGQGKIGGEGSSGTDREVSWILRRPAARPSAGPQIIDFEPPVFHGYFSSSFAPVLHIFPGDTIRSRTFDAGGRDAKKRGPGGNPETGPFYVEGALPGDTLVIKLNKLRVNRTSARQVAQLNGRTVTPAFVAAAKYDAEYAVDWTLDLEKGIARVAQPSEKMKNFTVPIVPMLGCIATAPPGQLSDRATELGPYGGNMDYNQMIAGTILYLPVFHAGALLMFGDGHAAMGDGEITGTALETSLDVDLTVDLIKGNATAFPRAENSEYVMSMGIGGSVADAIQIATAQLAEWIKREYGIRDSEVALVLGSVLRYDIAELVDPQFHVVAKVPKAALQGLK